MTLSRPRPSQCLDPGCGMTQYHRCDTALTGITNPRCGALNTCVLAPRFYTFLWCWCNTPMRHQIVVWFPTPFQRVANTPPFLSHSTGVSLRHILVLFYTKYWCCTSNLHQYMVWHHWRNTYFRCYTTRATPVRGATPAHYTSAGCHTFSLHLYLVLHH